MNEFISAFPFVNVLSIGLGYLFIYHAFKRVMNYLEGKENNQLIERFDHIHAILTFHMEAAYETVHKDNILVYSLDGVKPSEDDITKISHDFAKLTITLAGPNMMETFVTLYGDDETLLFVMLDYFNRRFEDDEIRSQAIDDIQNKEEI